MDEKKNVNLATYNDIPEHLKSYIENYYSEKWDNDLKYRNSAWQRLTTYLFALNTGALIASLSYVTGAPENNIMFLPIWLFAIGTTLTLIHAAIDYYINEIDLDNFSKNLKKFYSNTITHQDFKDNIISNYSFYNKYLHWIGWISALLFLFGMFFGISNI